MHLVQSVVPLLHRGAWRLFKALQSNIKIIVVEPGESAVLSGGQPGPHKIEGVGMCYTPRSGAEPGG